ncbi:hypothetical protein [Nesterenkonia ebinurensis]|uniref:hypothetical protein n=1 Tax=Nesterenkonia ebinurensis TaxID=2608252 RepID=UPI00123E3723|nr:hypothetical protein [Nesterenkonia ebinurensis]
MSENTGNNEEPQQPDRGDAAPPPPPEGGQQPPVPPVPRQESPAPQQPEQPEQPQYAAPSQPSAPGPEFSAEPPAHQQPGQYQQQPVGYPAQGQPGQQYPQQGYQQPGYPPQQGYPNQGQDGSPEVSVPEFLKAVRLPHILTVLIAQGITYGVLFVFALLMVILTLIAGAVSDGGDFGDLTGTGDATTVWAFITLPFQFTAMWLFGTLRASEGGDAFFALWAPNLFVVGVAIGVAVWIGRRWASVKQKKDPANHPVSLGWGAKLLVVAGLSLGLSLITLLLTFALTFRQDGAALGATGVALFFGSLLVYLVVALLVVSPADASGKVTTAMNKVLPSARQAPRAVVIHFLTIAVPVLITTIIWGGVEEGLFLIVLLLWLGVPMVAFGSVTLSHIGGVTVAATEGNTTYRETLNLWTDNLFPWWVILLLVLLTVIALVLASFSWALARDNRALGNPLSWLTLPLAFAAAGIIASLFGRISMEINFGGFIPFVPAGDVSFGPSWWTFSVFMLGGVVVEVLSRFMAPFVVNAFPPALKGLLSGTKNASAKQFQSAGAQQPQQQGGYPQQPQQGYPQQGQPGGYQPQPVHYQQPGYPQQPQQPPPSAPSAEPGPPPQPPQHGQQGGTPPPPPQPGQPPHPPQS